MRKAPGGSRVVLLAGALLGAAPAGAQAAAAPPLVILGPPSTAEAEARRAAAEAFVGESELAMGRRFDRSHRARVVDRLASGRAGALDSAHAEGATSALGDTGADLVYTPLVPCRVLDTRRAPEGPLDPGVPRSFIVAGTEHFEAQGGNAGGCGVPLGPATAVAVNLVVVDPSGNGHLRGWAVSDKPAPPPMASVLNFGTVPGLAALANGVVLPICDQGVGGGPCPSDLRLQAYGSSTHVVGDVLGYFRRVDLDAALLLGADGFGPVAATGGTLHVGAAIVTTPPRDVECVVTCSITLDSVAPNPSGQAYVQAGARAVDVTAAIWGGHPMHVPPVATPGAGSATTTTWIGLGGSLRFQFGCYVSAAGDFLGDELTGNVSWVCR